MTILAKLICAITRKHKFSRSRDGMAKTCKRCHAVVAIRKRTVAPTGGQ